MNHVLNGWKKDLGLHAEADYEVGYGKPPAERKFQKGKSGNPKGRPKRTKPVGDALEMAADAKVTVTENGRRRVMRAAEAVLMKAMHSALQNPRGHTTLIKLVVASDRARAAKAPAPAPMKDEDHRQIMEIVDMYQVAEALEACGIFGRNSEGLLRAAGGPLLHLIRTTEGEKRLGYIHCVQRLMDQNLILCDADDFRAALASPLAHRDAVSQSDEGESGFSNSQGAADRA